MPIFAAATPSPKGIPIKIHHNISLSIMEPPRGIEPPTVSLQGSCSGLLSYGGNSDHMEQARTPLGMWSRIIFARLSELSRLDLTWNPVACYLTPAFGLVWAWWESNPRYSWLRARCNAHLLLQTLECSLHERFHQHWIWWCSLYISWRAQISYSHFFYFLNHLS